jgi:predicted permease
MRESSTRTTASGARARLRSALVVGEVALAMLLVVGAGLLIKSFYNLMRVDMGFNQSQLSTFGVVLPAPAYTTARRIDFYTRLTEDLQSLPGVSAVSAMSGLPPLRNVNANDTDFEHIPNNRPPGSLPGENVDYWQYVTSGYSQTMGIKVVQGRTFEPADATGAPVALVNEALVKKFFTDRSPIGARVRPGFNPQAPWLTIVGVLKDVKQGGVDQAAGTELYMLVDQVAKVQNFAPGNLNFVVRASVPFDSLANDFRRAVGKLDPTLPLIRMRPMDDVIDAAVARPRFLTLLLGIFAGLALLLAAVGTYGILSHLVSTRQQEIGIRMALGADRSEILRLVLGRGLLLSGLGLALGLGASFGLTRLIKTMLFNVTPTDPVTLSMVAGVIAFVSIAACLVPAWRATRVDPLIVLKAE